MQAVAVTEGEKKALALLKAGLPAIGLGGAWCFRGPDGDLVEPLGDWDWRDRVVYLIPDADWRQNPDILQAWTTLSLLLASKGAAPYTVTWDPGLGKGVDDALVAGLDVQEAIREARPLTDWVAYNAPRCRVAILSALASVDLPADLADGLIRAAAKALKVSPGAVRVEVKRRREAKEEVEKADVPDPEPPNGPELLRKTESFLKQYVVFTKPQDPFIIALWVAHTWIFDQLGYSPRLAISSPAKRSGKTTLLSALARVVCNPLMAADVSPAYLVRVIDDPERPKPTLLLDEAADWLVGHGPDRETARLVASVLRRGYRPGQSTGRCEKDGRGRIVLKEFDPFAPVAFAFTGADIPDDALADRSVRIALERKPRSVQTKRFIEAYVDEDAAPIADAWWRWAVSVWDTVSEAYRRVLDWMSETWTWLNDRAVEAWAALGTALYLLDPSRFSELEAAAREVARNEPPESVGEHLLACIREIFREKGVTELRVSELLAALNDAEAHPDWPWSDYAGGRGLSPHKLSRILNAFGIASTHKKEGRYYRVEDFVGAWRRYLGDSDPVPVTISEVSDQATG
jgi:putative DNA primase/helicase